MNNLKLNYLAETILTSIALRDTAPITDFPLEPRRVHRNPKVNATTVCAA